MNALLPLLLALSALSAAPAAAAGRLVSATGPVSSGGKTLKPGSALPDAELVLSSGSAVISLGKSRFLLTGPARLTPRAKRFELARGGLLSVVRGLAGRFSVRTPAAVAAVRGTDFYVDARSEGETYVCICSGELGVAHRGKTHGLASEKHAASLFGPAGAEKAAMEGHTDAQLGELRALE